jgi:glucuronoarabinoxylan endo-1,4-beta-xylanase
MVSMPGRSLNTYIFTIERENTPVQELAAQQPSAPKAYFDLNGRRMQKPYGFCIEQRADGSFRKVFIGK